jgi:ABC-type branched-subunit amino acid transport system permease subunit
VLGIPGIPRPEAFGVDFYSNAHFLVLIAAFALVCQVFFWLLHRGPFGRALRAQAEYDEAVLAVGRDSGLIRNIGFMISSATAGLAGSFFAYYLNYIDPSSFSLTEMVFVLTIVVVGRPGRCGSRRSYCVSGVIARAVTVYRDEFGVSWAQPGSFAGTDIIRVVCVNRKSLFPPA